MTPERVAEIIDQQATTIANLRGEVDKWGWIARWLADIPDDITDAIEAWHQEQEQEQGKQ